MVLKRGRSLAWIAGVLLGVAGLAVMLFGAAEGRADDGPPYVHAAAHAADRAAPSAVPPERPAPGGVSGQFVHGVDDRERITETELFPWSAYAFLELYQEGVLIGSCSGIFIGPDAILTAAHCLYDPVYGWTTDVAVVPGKDGSSEPFGYDWGSQWWVADGWIDFGGSELFDWGIIRLPSSTLGNAVGWLPIGVLSDETLSASGFTPAIAGYPADAVPARTLWGHWANAFAIVDDFLLYYDIDTMAGVSGAPIISLAEGDHLGTVVGIHTTGGQVYNSGSRIDLGILYDLMDGCSSMGCTFYYYVEGDPTPTPTQTPIPTTTIPSTPTNTPTPSPTPTNSPTPEPTPSVPLDYRLVVPQVSRN